MESRSTGKRGKGKPKTMAKPVEDILVEELLLQTRTINALKEQNQHSSRVSKQNKRRVRRY